MPTRYTLTINCEDDEELAAIISKINGKPAKPAKEVVADEEEDEAPAKSSKPAKASKKSKGDDAADTKEEIRGLLKQLAEATDRKTAMKVLNQFAEGLDEVDESEYGDLKAKLEAKLDA